MSNHMRFVSSVRWIRTRHTWIALLLFEAVRLKCMLAIYVPKYWIKSRSQRCAENRKELGKMFELSQGK
jgi:hypothetical protein